MYCYCPQGLDYNDDDIDDADNHQSQKNPVSASAMLTGKFLRIRKVFATCSLLAEEFPDNLENVRMLHKISRKKCPDNLENVSGSSGKCPDDLESFLTIKKVSG